MNSSLLLKNIFRFLFIMLLQVLFLDHIRVTSYVSIYAYILFIMLLPFNTPKGLLLLLGFLTGLIIDLFNGTIGMHSSACLLIAFIRPYLLKMITVGHEYEYNGEPNINTLGFDWFVAYAAILTVIYQFTYCFIETSSFNEIGITLLRIVCSSLVSLLFILLIQVTFNYNRKKR